MPLNVAIHRSTEALQTEIWQLQVHCWAANFAAILSCTAAGITSLCKTTEFVCKLVAIALHLSFLSVFSWMHLIAWSLFVMIVGRTRFLAELMIQLPNWVKSYLHFTLGWALPVVIVLCGIGLEYSWSPGFMGYGKDGLCWINGNRGMLFLFLVSNFCSVKHAE